MRFLTWNLEWARPGSKREGVIRECLTDADPDIICLTEAFSATLPEHGHVIEAGVGNPVADRKGAKKVLLWSRNEWSDASSAELFNPPGRIASGRTSTKIGPLRIIGICIPWPASNTPRFGGDRRLWEDHLGFLAPLGSLLSSQLETSVVFGDFNQRLPRKRQPVHVADALEQALSNVILPTRNFRSEDGDDTIDHIAHTPDLQASEIRELRRHQDGLRLSDHFGVMASIHPA